jgi:DNA-binding transcriptional LysR family regulator
VGDLALKHKLLLSGLGWGGMPELMVRADIESGRLVRLLARWRAPDASGAQDRNAAGSCGPMDNRTIGGVIL